MAANEEVVLAETQDICPDCFGMDFRGPGRDCDACSAPSTQCASLSGTLGKWRSVSEVLTKAEDDLRPPADEDIDDTYRRYYRQHFGFKPRGVETDRGVKSFGIARQLCNAEGIDVTTWITAQMHGLRKWLADPTQNTKKLRFMPSMLCGPKARKRYNIYLRMAHGHFKRAEVDSFDGCTDEGILLAGIAGGEERIGEYYVSSRLVGETVSEAQAIEAAEPGLNWLALFVKSKPTAKTRHIFKRYVVLRTAFGEERLEVLKAVVQVRAAFSVAERVRHGLADRVGYVGGMRFPWPAFAQLLERLAPARASVKPSEDIGAVSGHLWGGSYGG